ncbi:hypothetical protein [Bacterioplanoides pacificum]|uniref:Uncharacterized protein n=1 Tax=Bacterioplanoides pacificum TaxID=1171596 RepID=A0ABV7VUW4_9GAMM
MPNGKDNSYFVAKFTQKNVVFDGLQYDADGEGRSNNIIDGGNSSSYSHNDRLMVYFDMNNITNEPLGQRQRLFYY